MERYYFHKDRHVVAATGDAQDGRMPVRWVCLSPGVAGTSKRGRRPLYAEPVPVTELTEITDETVISQVATAAGSDSAS